MTLRFDKSYNNFKIIAVPDMKILSDNSISVDLGTNDMSGITLKDKMSGDFLDKKSKTSIFTMNDVSNIIKV